MTPKQNGDGTNPSTTAKSAPSNSPAQSSRVIDLQRLRSPQSAPRVRQLPTRPRTDKPPKTAFFRVRRGEQFQVQASILEFGEGLRGDAYLLLDGFETGVESAILIAVVLRLAITLDGQIYVWPVRIPAERPNRWHASAWAAMELAEDQWVRMVANQANGEYDLFEALDDLGEPRFADEPFDVTVTRAFEGRVIESPDHPVLRALRGEKS